MTYPLWALKSFKTYYKGGFAAKNNYFSSVLCRVLARKKLKEGAQSVNVRGVA